MLQFLFSDDHGPKMDPDDFRALENRPLYEAAARHNLANVEWLICSIPLSPRDAREALEPLEGRPATDFLGRDLGEKPNPAMDMVRTHAQTHTAKRAH